MVFRQLHQLKNPEAFVGWLTRIVLHTSYRLKKKHPITEELPVQASVKGHAQQVSDSVTLKRALARLSRTDRDILLLFDLLRLNHQEVECASHTGGYGASQSAYSSKALDGTAKGSLAPVPLLIA